MCEQVREIIVPYRYQTDQEGEKGERLSLTSWVPYVACYVASRSRLV